MGKFIGKLFKDRELFIAFIILIMIFSTLADRFLVLENISNILRGTSIGGLLVLGLSFEMIGRGFDLSFATAAGLLSILGLMFIDAGISLLFTFLLLIALGSLWGLMNGFLVVKLGINPFIATFSTWLLAKGFIYTIGRGRTFYGDYPDSLIIIGRTNIINFLPICATIFIVCGIISYIIADHAKFGKHLYAIGSNIEAAGYAGIKVDRCRMITFGLGGIFIGLAAIVLGSRLTCGPVAAGDGYQMIVIASVFLGATVFKPGFTNIRGSILSIFFLSIFQNGLTMLHVPFYFKYVVQGAIILIAVSYISRKRRGEGLSLF